MTQSLTKKAQEMMKGCGQKGTQGMLVATCGKELYCPRCKSKIQKRIFELQNALKILEDGK